MKNYIKILSFIFVSLLFAETKAQQNKVSTHFPINPYLYNPAQVGEEGYTSFSLHYRNQWINMPESPDTKLFAAQGMIADKYGIGGKVYIDRSHIVKSYGAMASYAYYIRMKKNPKRHYLSIGLSAGFKYQQLAFDEATIKDDFDPSIFYDGVSRTVFDAEAGIRYRFKGLNLGVMASNLSPHTYNYARGVKDLEYSPAYHIYGSAGYDIFLNKKKTMQLKPSVLVRYIPNIPIQFDANLLFDYKETFWIGGGYRYKNTGVWAMAGFRVHNNVAATYSYEQSIDGFQAALGSSHEISVELRLNKKKNKEKEELERKIENLKKYMTVKNKDLIDSLKAVQTEVDGLEEEIVDLEEEMKSFEKELSNVNITNNNGNLSTEDGNAVIYKSVGKVNFFVNSARLHEEQLTEAEAIYAKMAPSITDDKIILIRIVGSASIEGSEEYNLLLSNRRTESIREFFSKKGIDSDVIITSFKGNSEAIARDVYNGNDAKPNPNPEDRYVKVFILTTK